MITVRFCGVGRFGEKIVIQDIRTVVVAATRAAVNIHAEAG